MQCAATPPAFECTTAHHRHRQRQQCDLCTSNILFFIWWNFIWVNFERPNTVSLYARHGSLMCCCCCASVSSLCVCVYGCVYVTSRLLVRRDKTPVHHHGVQEQWSRSIGNGESLFFRVRCCCCCCCYIYLFATTVSALIVCLIGM